MHKDLNSVFDKRNLFVLFWAILICVLNSCGGSGGGGDSGGGPTPAVITWAKTYGGSYDDSAYSIIQSANGEYVIAGFTIEDSNNEVLVLKIDFNGNVIWQYTCAGVASSIINLRDGSYLIAGLIYPLGNPIGDIGIFKVNSNGVLDWEKNYNLIGGIAYDVKQTSDGGLVIVGVESGKIWILKVEADGKLDWEKNFGGSGNDIGYAIQETSDGFIIAGETGRFDSDIWIFKIDNHGTNVLWQNFLGGTGYDAAYSIQGTSDGGYIAAGQKSSSAGDADFWIGKLNSDGQLEWEKTYGGSGHEIARSIQQTSDGGYIVAGETSTSAGDIDFLILKLNGNGDLVWQKTYGNSGNDTARSIQQTIDGGYVVAGETTTNAGDTDFWVLKLDSNGNLN